MSRFPTSTNSDSFLCAFYCCAYHNMSTFFQRERGIPSESESDDEEGAKAKKPEDGSSSEESGSEEEESAVSLLLPLF